MANDLELKVRISAELKELRQALQGVQGDLRGLKNESDKAGKGAGFNGLESTLKGIRNQIVGIAAGFASIQSVKALLGATDEYARLNAQLKLTTGSVDELNRAQEEVYRIAQLTRAPIADVANTYATLSRSTEALGVSQEELVNVLETVNKAIALTPVSAETARATLVQFGQALAGDFKAGAQEINSILEQTPGLAIAIAKGLGVAVSDLKKMGEEGKLSAEQVFKALQSVGTSIDEQFRQIPLTVGGVVTQIKNDFLVAFGQADVSPLIDELGQLREVLTDPATIEGLTSIASGIVTLTSVVVEAVSEVGRLGKELGFMAAAASGNVTELDRIEREIRLVDLAMKDSWLSKPIAYWGKSKEDLEIMRQALVKAREAVIREQGLGSSQAGNKDRTAQLEAQRKALADKAKADLEAAKAASEQAAAEEKARKAAESRQKSIDQILEGLKKQAETYGKSEEAVVRYDLAQLGATKAEQDRAAQLVKTIQALKDKEKAEEDAKKAAEEAKKAEEDLQRELANIQVRALQNAGRLVEARKLELELQYGDTIKRLQEKGDAAGLALVTGLIDTEVSKANLEELERQVDTVNQRIAEKFSQQTLREEDIGRQQELGAVSDFGASAEINASREQTIQQIRTMREELVLLAEQGAPGAKEAIAELDQRINQMGVTAPTIFKQIAQGASQSLGNAFADIITGAKSASDAFRDFGRSFAAMLAQMAAQALASLAIFTALRALGVPLPVLQGMGLVGAGVKHTGGVIGMGGTVRNVNPALFAMAPRYHVGGVAGLKPGEVPAILQTGEEVLARNDPRNVMNGGGQGQGGSTRIINVIDPNLVADYMTSSAGEETLVNLIQRNAGSIKQVLT